MGRYPVTHHEAYHAGDDPEHRRSLAKMVMKLFDHWQLSSVDQLMLLGLNPESRASLTRYRKGQPLSNNRDLLERVGHLLSIHKSLRLIYPRNPELAYRWMTTSNARFGQQSPVDVIREQGFKGLLMIRCYLDRERGR